MQRTVCRAGGPSCAGSISGRGRSASPGGTRKQAAAHGGEPALPAPWRAERGRLFLFSAEAPPQAARREASPIPASKRVPAAQTARDRIKMVKKPMGTRVKRADSRSRISGFREQRPVFRSR